MLTMDNALLPKIQVTVLERLFQNNIKILDCDLLLMSQASRLEKNGIRARLRGCEAVLC